MRPQSAKAKGRRFQQEIAAKLLALFPDQLEPGDARSLSMGAAGHDILLSPAAERLIPFDFECKNVENPNVWSVIDQMFARDDRVHLGRHPIAVLRKNHTKPVAIFPLGWWFNLVMGRAGLPGASHERFSHDDIASAGPGPPPLWHLLRTLSHGAMDRSPDHADDIVWTTGGHGTHTLRLHLAATMPFWKTMDALMVPGRTGVVFNRGNRTTPLMVVVRWELVEALLVLRNTVAAEVEHDDPDIEHEGDPYPEHEGDPYPEHEGDPDGVILLD